MSYSSRHVVTRAALTFSDGVRSSARLAEVVERGRRRYNVDALAARVCALSPSEPEETPYVGIKCSLSGVPLRVPVREVHSSADAPRVLRRAIEAAVERTLGDVRCVGVMAGGGLDSAGLLAVAAAWAKPRGATVFAVALDYASRCDDRPYMRALESALGCEVIRVRPEEGVRHLSWTDGVDAAPFNWPSGPMEVELMARAKARGADCVLMGVGGDELFDGEPHSLAALARRGRVLSAVRGARSLRGFSRPRSRTFSWILRPIVGAIMPTAIRLRLARRRPTRMPSWAGPKLRSYLERERERDLAMLERNLRRGVLVDPSHHERHRANIAWLRHQEEVVSGIERRDPYLDRELIATVAGFEPDWLLHGNVWRGLFREALRDLLPRELLEREDKAYFEPAFVRLIGASEGLANMRDLALMTELAELGLVEPARFREAFDAFVAAPEDGTRWMTEWPALCVERFLRASRARSAT